MSRTQRKGARTETPCKCCTVTLSFTLNESYLEHESGENRQTLKDITKRILMEFGILLMQLNEGHCSLEKRIKTTNKKIKNASTAIDFNKTSIKISHPLGKKMKTKKKN